MGEGVEDDTTNGYTEEDWDEKLRYAAEEHPDRCLDLQNVGMTSSGPGVFEFKYALERNPQYVQKLRQLNLSNNRYLGGGGNGITTITGALKESLGDNSRLEKLFFNNCGLTSLSGPGFESGSWLAGLKEIWADNNSLSGQWCPPTMSGACRSLEIFSMKGNTTTGVPFLPPEFFQLPKDCKIVWDCPQVMIFGAGDLEFVPEECLNREVLISEIIAAFRSDPNSLLFVDAKAKAEAEAKAKAEAEAKAKAEAEAAREAKEAADRARAAEIQALEEREAEAKAATEREAADLIAKAKAEAEAELKRARLEAEQLVARAKEDAAEQVAAAEAKAEAEAKAKADADANAKAEAASPEEEEVRGRLVSADDAVTTSASPIYGLMDMAVVPLVEAVKDMAPEFTSFAYTFTNKDAPARDWRSAVQRQATRSVQEMKRRFAEEGKTFPLADFGGMTLEEAGAIHIYTVEGPFYHALNMVLRLEDRNRTKCAFKYVRLLASACSRLPHKEVELYRGVRCALTALQPKGSFDNGALVDLWSVTSAAQNLAVIKDFLGQQPSDDRTQLTLKCRYASDIAPFSSVKKETECILLPGAQFEVVQAATLVPRSGELVGEFSQVILQEVEGTFLQNLE